MIRVGVAGDVGSFSEEAGLIYIEKANLAKATISYLINMDGVLAALNHDEIDYGVFPVANKNSGLVKPAIEAMGKYNFSLVDTIDLNVEQCLFAKHHMRIEQISAIYSFHPALEQCKKFLCHEGGLKNTKIVDWGDMALAARDLAQGAIPSDCAVIGSRRAAEIYGLEVLVSGIQDIKINTTMFVIVR